jgi:hypothetical protein
MSDTKEKSRREYFRNYMRIRRARQRAADPDGYRQKVRAASYRRRVKNPERYREYMRLLMRVRRAKAAIAKLMGRPTDARNATQTGEQAGGVS